MPRIDNQGRHSPQLTMLALDIVLTPLLTPLLYLAHQRTSPHSCRSRRCVCSHQNEVRYPGLPSQVSRGASCSFSVTMPL